MGTPVLTGASGRVLRLLPGPVGRTRSSPGAPRGGAGVAGQRARYLALPLLNVKASSHASRTESRDRPCNSRSGRVRDRDTPCLNAEPLAFGLSRPSSLLGRGAVGAPS